MRRLGLALLLVVFAAVALPPLWFRLFREPAPELPAPGRRVDLAGDVAVNVLEEGAGPAVVLVHGHPGSAYDWRVLAPALAARGFRAIAYDRVGYGRSDARRDGEYTFAANARELALLLAALDLRDAIVVGWSYGGGTSIVAAQQDPSRIARLVLVGSVGPGLPMGASAVQAVLFSGPVLAWVAAVPPVSAAVQAAMSAGAFSGQPQPDWWRPSLAANLGGGDTRRTMREEGAAYERQAVPDPTRLLLPVLVIHGEDDRLVPVAVGHELARRAPNARLVLVPGGSHMLPVTHAELLAAEIADGLPAPR
jgi:pimeloyl-ACP methyl ester carboxylesterase